MDEHLIDRIKITTLVRRYVLDELGFDLVGFAPADRLGAEGVRLQEWLAGGLHGSMGWLERNTSKRQDPRQLLPEARSVIVVARNYYTPEPHKSGHAKISRYAWGRDYHKILPKKLKQLDSYLRTLHPGATSRWYVDTGPVMEKAWAVRAGLGWMGKHTNVISRDMGSWIFLGTLISSLPFTYDQPIADFCGECTACIQACPTQAITQPYVLDATRCISYITIEQKPKDAVPPELGRHFDDWVFGCDVCQDVCPWNSFQQITTEPAFHPRPGLRDMTAGQIAALDDAEFHRLFDGTPVVRAKPDGMRRNARTCDGDV